MQVHLINLPFTIYCVALQFQLDIPDVHSQMREDDNEE